MSLTEAKITTWDGEKAIELRAGGYEAVILPDAGANCITLRHPGLGADILRTPPTSAAMRTRPQVYGLPFLFPPNRIAGGEFTYGGIRYHLPITEPERGNHIHGFLIHCPFTVTELSAGDGIAHAKLSFSSGDHPDYYRDFPNDFTATIECTLSEEGLSHTASIENRSDFPLPLGVGFHSAFHVPFTASGRSEDTRLMASVDETWPLHLPGNATPLGHPDTDPQVRQALREEGIDPLGSFPAHWSAAPMTYAGQSFHGAVLRDTGAGLDLVYEVEDPYRFWVFWNEGGGKDFVCAEPQTWMIDAPHMDLPPQVSGFTPIPAGETMVCRSRIGVRKSK